MTNSKKRKMESDRVHVLKSEDFWVNIVDFLQQYWALIETDEEKVTVYFINDGSSIFTTMDFETPQIAEKALRQNGFKRFDDPLEKYADYLNPPKKPYTIVEQSNNPIINT